ncbi:MAG: VOC family protein [Acidobacteria bacterium]|nr:VOC family protein [Acidobacteriota bacterium]
MPTAATPTTGSRVIPCMRYRDAPAAIDWLCEVFSFTRQLIVPGEDGTVIHSQLVLGTGMVMVGSVRDDHYGTLVKQPDQCGGAETQACCLIVDDPDAVYARVLSGGGTIIRDIQDESYGGRAFTCRDREGHLWTVGSYNPWA